MADATLSTNISRRAILAGGSAAATVCALAAPGASARPLAPPSLRLFKGGARGTGAGGEVFFPEGTSAKAGGDPSRRPFGPPQGEDGKDSAGPPQGEDGKDFPHAEEQPLGCVSKYAENPAVSQRSPEAAPDPDAALLRRLALIDRLGERYVARQERHRRRIKARYYHRQRWTEAGPTCLGYWPADPDGWRMFDRYANATRSALAVPAHTARGILAKLGLARRAALTGDRRVYMYEDIDDWLGDALADLARLAGEGRSG